MREDSPFGNMSHSLAAIWEQGLSQLNCRSTSANPTTATGSLRVVVSQHSAKASSNLCSTGSSSRLNTNGRPPHEPLRKEDFTDTLDSIGWLSVDSFSDASARPLSFCKMNSWHWTLAEGQPSSAIHRPSQISSLCAFEMPVEGIPKWIIQEVGVTIRLQKHRKLNRVQAAWNDCRVMFWSRWRKKTSVAPLPY